MAELQPIVADALQQIVIAVVAALGIVLAAAVRKWQAAAVERLQVQTQSERWRAAIGKLDTAAANAVDAVEQTMVRQFKAASADGKITADEAREALHKAVHDVRLQLGPDAWVEILGALQLTPERGGELLRTLVEAHVARRKSGNVVAIAAE